MLGVGGQSFVTDVPSLSASRSLWEEPPAPRFLHQHVHYHPESPAVKDYGLKTWKIWLQIIASTLYFVMCVTTVPKTQGKRKSSTPIIWLGTETTASLGTPSQHFYPQCQEVSSQTSQCSATAIGTEQERRGLIFTRCGDLASGRISTQPLMWLTLAS